MSRPGSAGDDGNGSEHGLVVVREYRPDPERVVAAVIKLLEWGAQDRRERQAAEPEPEPAPPSGRAEARR